ncbi:flavin reductase family protein [Thiocapsa roseopersicina]|uniref:NADH-FMN oxidoreductase RutF, flavin reductase (DIM6/NTAB) family n=1 Tax=Thiocapsa roseopersicina TaxID=1058 RepID=A0A1H3AHN7_THIRO|nr:flavin reductase family protein [Thiocapsa roseopersicina]SDX28349.1 NADH-FMN oxidoreductase RutF, flavin reductase (DIM6/NTAB) family [Thiocapsa roseopersicina]
MRPEVHDQSPAQLNAINEVFHLYDPPLWLVTACDGARRGGFIATAATRASIVYEIPRMLVAVAQHHHTWGLIEASGSFALHLLAADDIASVRRFGLASGHRVDKLADLPPRQTPAGAPLIEGAMSWMDCRVEARMDIGDRTTYLAEVTAGAVLRRGPLLTVAGLLRDAPEADRSELKRLYAQDQETDRAAILAWRRSCEYA